MNKRNTIRIAALFIAGIGLLLDASLSSAQDLDLQFRNGLVTLVARGVTVPQILDRWARAGGVTIVNGEKVPSGVPMTLQLVDVPERRALAILLREVGGYVLAERGDDQKGPSVIDRILILSPSGVQVQNSPAPPLVRVQDSGTSPVASSAFPPEQVADPDPQPLGSGQVGQDVSFPRGNAATVGNQAGVSAGGSDGSQPPSTATGTPLGFAGGSATPGMITTAPPPRYPSGPDGKPAVTTPAVRPGEITQPPQEYRPGIAPPPS